MENRVNAVTMLLTHGANPNIASNGGWTPCMIAASNGHTACLRALADGTTWQEGRTLDVNAVGTGGPTKGMTALDIALKFYNEEAAAYLRDELGALRAAGLVPSDGGGGDGSGAQAAAAAAAPPLAPPYSGEAAPSDDDGAAMILRYLN